jgi:hypothetical protein
LLQVRSQDAVEIVNDSEYGMVFIDGTHTYDAILDDLNNYGALVADGGMLLLHDYFGSFEAEVAAGFMVQGFVTLFLNRLRGINS